jgi:hypothetical protein
MDSDYPFGIFKLFSVVSMDSDYPFGIFKLFSVVSMDSDYPFGIFKLFSVVSMDSGYPMLFNRSIQEMVFPGQWEISHVIALFKKGDESLPSNYRPVSLLSCVSKILEKIVDNKTDL